jgi:uncharacterized Zn-binding protein involved in type VI secretion
MGMPAARVGDVCAPHPDVCIIGSPNVMVNSLPFHRAFDMHICPIIGVGITLLGSGLVKVNNLPAARVGSMGRCITPNVIVTGSPTVLVGG